MKFAALLLSLILLAGCTIVPKLVIPTTPSIDNGVANSGFLGPLPDNKYFPGPNFEVSAKWAEEYAALVKQYGAKLMPPMTEARWITPASTNTYAINWDALQAYGEMKAYFRQHQSLQ